MKVVCEEVPTYLKESTLSIVVLEISEKDTNAFLATKK